MYNVSDNGKKTCNDGDIDNDRTIDSDSAITCKIARRVLCLG